MHRMKHFLYACGFLFMGIMSQALNAQEASTSRLTVGFDVGFVFDNYTDTITKALDAHTIQLRSTYRLTRWLGIAAHLGYGRVSEADNFFLNPTIRSLNGPLTLVRTTQRIPAVIGPEINIRIGQGDLSVGAQFGLLYNQSKVFLINPIAEYVLKYDPTVDFYKSLSFSYTYWPQQRFGVRIGVQLQDWLPGNYSSSELKARSQQKYPDLNPLLSGLASPGTTALELKLFQIGLTYRL